MDQGQKKAKHERERAEKRKHEHETGEKWEEVSRKKHARKEEIGAILMIVVFGAFMVFGVILWPGTSEKETGNSGLADGEYSATFLGNRPAADGEAAIAAVEVEGEVYLVNENDLSGNARENGKAFFSIPDDQAIEITVEDGFITDWGET